MSRGGTGRTIRTWIATVALLPALVAQAQDDDIEAVPEIDVTELKEEAAKDEVPEAAVAYNEEEQQAAQEGIAGFFNRSADNITSQLNAGWNRFSGFLADDPITQLGDQWRDLNQRLQWSMRLDLGLAYTALYQAATEARGPSTAASGDFDFFGTWHLVGEEGATAGKLGFATEQRHRFTEITPSQLNQSIGSQLLTTGGFNQFSFTLTQIWWQQELADGHVFTRFGKISQSDFFATGRFRSANFFFLNQAFSASLAVPFPTAGPGAVVFGFPTESVYIGAGLGQAVPDETDFGLSTSLRHLRPRPYRLDESRGILHRGSWAEYLAHDRTVAGGTG